MQKQLNFCDRCGAQVMKDIDSEIEIRAKNLEGEYDFQKSFKELLLCSDCLNMLIKWFGPINPRNNLFFKLIK